jgi:hypothetical protein
MSISNRIIQDNPDKYETLLKSRILGKTLQLKLNQYNALQSQYDTLLQYENNNHNQAAARDAVCKSRNPGTAIVKDVKTKCRAGGCDYALGSTGWIDFCNASNAESTCCGTNNTTVTFDATGFQDWTDIPNTSYQYGMVPNSTASTDDWKFLGKTDNLTNCKLKAVEDKNTTFSSVVYYPSDFSNEVFQSAWNKSCFGGVKGKNGFVHPQPKTITSLAPNGTTILGGDEGEKLLKQMKSVQKEINKLTTQIKRSSDGLEKTKPLFDSESIAKNNELDQLLAKLEKDRIEINKTLNEPDETAIEDDSRVRQIQNYTTYGLWLLLVIISLFVVFYLYIRNDSDIPVYIYLFIAVWVLVFIKYYYNTVQEYGANTWKYITSIPIPIPIPI